MAINYSLALRSNPSDLDATPKYHATPQVTDVLDINQFAQHIADHGCVYSRADMQAKYELTTEIILKFEIIPLPLQRQTIKN